MPLDNGVATCIDRDDNMDTVIRREEEESTQAVALLKNAYSSGLVTSHESATEFLRGFSVSAEAINLALDLLSKHYTDAKLLPPKQPEVPIEDDLSPLVSSYVIPSR